MALKVELKPHERIIIGACVITNTDQRARLLIDGDNIPILREKDILTPETADTPAKRVDIAEVGAVIDDRRTYCKLAVEQRGGRRCDARFLNVEHDLAIKLVGVIGAVAKAHDVELHRGH